MCRQRAREAALLFLLGCVSMKSKKMGPFPDSGCIPNFESVIIVGSTIFSGTC